MEQKQSFYTIETMLVLIQTRLLYDVNSNCQGKYKKITEKYTLKEMRSQNDTPQKNKHKRKQ